MDIFTEYCDPSTLRMRYLKSMGLLPLRVRKKLRSHLSNIMLTIYNTEIERSLVEGYRNKGATYCSKIYYIRFLIEFI